MDIAIDIETQGLDCTKYIASATAGQDGRYTKEFTDKTEQWNYILEIGKKLAKHKKVLNVYSHNATYDFYGYADLTDSKIRFFSHRPFIAAYLQKIENKNKEIIKFLDTFAIYKISLKKVGEIIGLPKLEIPQELLEKDPQELKMEEVLPYMKRDTEICLKSIQYLKERLKEEDVAIKRLYTISQIAMAYVLNKLMKIPEEKYKNDENRNFMFWNQKLGEVRRTFRAEQIHAAYRGGRVQCFKYGLTKGVTAVDRNSSYTYEAQNLKFPDLTSERMTWRPLETYNQKELLDKIGLSRVLIKNNTNKIGVLPVRTPEFSFYPKENTQIIGTYTHQEITEALSKGYELIDIEYSVTFKEAPFNPLKEIYTKIYDKRLDKSNEKFNKWFYKDVANRSIGKFAQTRTGQEIVIDSVEKVHEYLKKGFNQIKGIDYQYMYARQNVPTTPKKYYCPIIPTLITANARLNMYREFEKIPYEDLVYTDTDSIIFTGNHLDKLNIGNGLGQFKIEDENKEIMIWGRKTYQMDDKVKIAGIMKKSIDLELLKQGIAKSKQMVTLSTTKDLTKVGTFKDEERNLNDQLSKLVDTNKLLQKQRVMIDSDIKDINHFIHNIET